MPTAATTTANSDSSLISKQGKADLSTLTQPARGPGHGGHFIGLITPNLYLNLNLETDVFQYKKCEITEKTRARIVLVLVTELRGRSPTSSSVPVSGSAPTFFSPMST